MALIVEDGTGLADADSFLSLADARVIAANYGYTLPDDDTQAEVQLRKGAGYVDLHENRFSGERKQSTQSLTWPRSNSYRCRNGMTYAIDGSEVPNEAKMAQVIAAATYANGESPRGNDNGRITTGEEVGPVKVTYSDSSATGNTFAITESVDAMKDLFCSGGPMRFRTLRA